MSSLVRLNVPPFEPAAPTSLAALRRPLVAPEATHCDAQCKPCPQCEAAQAERIAEARKLSADTGLRLSQLVEDALTQHVARMEAQQTTLVSTILTQLLPHLADAALRRAIGEELNAAFQSLRNEPLKLVKHPDLDLGPLADDARLTFEEDASLSVHDVRLRDGAGTIQIEADTLIQACLTRLKTLSGDTDQ